MVNSNGSSSHQFFPNIVIDPTTGVIYIVYYDRSKSSGNETDVWMARSDDGGESFLNFEISKKSFSPVDTVFFGDYIDIDAHSGIIYAGWMRMDDAQRSVWCAKLIDAKLEELDIF